MTTTEKSKSQIKIEATITKLEAQRVANKGLSAHDARILASAKYKLDSRSASKLFKECEALPAATKKELLGTHAFPKAKDFFDALPKNKMLFSMWDALGVLTAMNKNGQRAARAAMQEKKQKGAPTPKLNTPKATTKKNTPKIDVTVAA
jgi:hypothetical protein